MLAKQWQAVVGHQLAKRNADQRTCFDNTLAVVFDDLAPRLQEQLALVCDLLSQGPPLLPTTAPTASEHTDGHENDEASLAEESPEEGS